jgi:hypothetical protein
MPSAAQYSSTPASPTPSRLTTTPTGRPSSSRATCTARRRSWSPKGVGSVTSRTKSAPRIVSTTGQEVPGDASRMVRPPCPAHVLGLQLADDGHGHRLAHVQCRDQRRSARPGLIPGCPSRAAPRGWLLRAVERTTAAAVAQLGKDEHLAAHHGDGVPDTHLGAAAAEGAAVKIHLGDQDADLLAVVEHRACRKSAALGSSTSQSRNKTGADLRIRPIQSLFRTSAVRANARLVATVVLPVPPLPLATAMIIVQAPPISWKRPFARCNADKLSGAGSRPAAASVQGYDRQCPVAALNRFPRLFCQGLGQCAGHDPPRLHAGIGKDVGGSFALHVLSQQHHVVLRLTSHSLTRMPLPFSTSRCGLEITSWRSTWPSAVRTVTRAK